MPPQCPQSCDDGNTGYWCAESSLPVLVWIYGGGFTVGYGAGLQKNGTAFANRTNSIVVSMNYRVGALGSHSVILYILNKTSLINGAIVESFFGGDGLATTEPYHWSHVVNTSIFPTDPIFSFQSGDFNQKVAFFIGVNLGEYYFFMSS